MAKLDLDLAVSFTGAAAFLAPTFAPHWATASAVVFLVAGVVKLGATIGQWHKQRSDRFEPSEPASEPVCENLGVRQPHPPSPPPSPDPLAYLHLAYREQELSLAAWLRSLADEMDAGTWMPSLEALVVVKAVKSIITDEGEESEIVTVLYWGEDSGLTSSETLSGIAELNRKQ